MKIGEPVEKLPVRANSHYDEIYRALESIDGKALPVECKDKRELERVYNAMRAHGFRVQRIGLTVYIAKK